MLVYYSYRMAIFLSISAMEDGGLEKEEIHFFKPCFSLLGQCLLTPSSLGQCLWSSVHGEKPHWEVRRGGEQRGNSVKVVCLGVC